MVLAYKSGYAVILFGIVLQQICYQMAMTIRTVQELIGHQDVKTTMIYTHVLNRGGYGVQSPLDKICWIKSVG